MSLLREQVAFQRDIRKLFDFIESRGLTFTFGEVYRTREQQEIYVKTGRSKTMNSQHLKRLAVDLNFFKEYDGNYIIIENRHELQPIGDYWESLSPQNEWGGNWHFYDGGHFQRKES